MKEFMPIETPYNSKDYQIMKAVISESISTQRSIDSNVSEFPKSQFTKSPVANDSFRWNIHESELPVLYFKLDELYKKTGDDDYESLMEEIKKKKSLEKKEESRKKIVAKEMIDPYDPMDGNQTIDGYPKNSSDLTGSEFSFGEAKLNESLGTLGLAYDKQGSTFPEHPELAENDRERALAQRRALAKQNIANKKEYIITGKPDAGDHAHEPIKLTLSQDGRVLKVEGTKSMPSGAFHNRLDLYTSSGWPFPFEEDYMIKAGELEQWCCANKSLLNGHNTCVVSQARKRFLSRRTNENDSDSLRNAHGENLKPENLKEDDIDEDSLAMRHRADQRGKIGEEPLGQHAPHSQATLGEESETVELPKNKPLINGKYRTKQAIKSAIYKALASNHVEGRYNDENWIGISKLKDTLDSENIPYEILDAKYEGQGQAIDSTLPTKKVYKFELNVRNKDGKHIALYLHVTCAFVGKTGTMADAEYEVTYYFLA